MGKTLETVTTQSKSSLKVHYYEQYCYSVIENKNLDEYKLILKMFWVYGDKKYILG